MKVHLNGHTIEQRQEYIEVTSMQEPDPDWLYVDKSKHTHRWVGEDIPTVRRVEDYPGDDEYPFVSHYECKECGQEIYPQYRSPRHRQYVNGLTMWFIDGEEVTKEEASKVMGMILK